MTYSIVARDPATGQLGVAVQSHYFGTGRVVTWAEAGVGAVATQSIVEVSYGPLGVAGMRAGESAQAVLDRLVAADAMAVVRQVGMVDAQGGVAVHTGAGCVGAAGHETADQVTAQANMMENPTVWRSMIRAFQEARSADLATRLLIALEAAEADGGDIRGRQSAALLVVGGERGDVPWDGRLVDLRVDDSDAPLPELRRLLDVYKGVERMTTVFEGGLLFTPTIDPDSAEMADALEHLTVAQAALGDNREPTFWSAVLLAKAGRTEDARARLASAAETNSRWPAFLGRLAVAGILPSDSPLLSG